MHVIGKIETIVSHLEMFAPPERALQHAPQGAEIVKAWQPTLSFYRYLYDTIGGDWLWLERRMMDQDKLLTKIRHPQNELRILWLHGVPAGMAEFDFRDIANVELLYFGLIPDFIGQGLGRFFIDWSCRHAFAKGARRFWVHTCDLDHPAALSNYQKAGFTLFDRETVEETILHGMFVPEHVKNRIISSG